MVAKPVSFRIAGRVPIGGGQPVLVQTMCNTSTDDIAASVAQCRAMAAAGADLIRLTTQGLKQVESLREIKRQLRAEGFVIIGVEQTCAAVSLEKFVPEAGKRYAFVFGNEVDGVAQEVVDACDGCVEIPQFGTKHSLNVSVSVGVVLWHAVNAILNR